MRWIRLLLLFGVLAYGQIELNFKNLDINDFIKMVAKITNKNILITQPIRGKVNFISVKPVSEDEVYSILLNILRSKGYTLIEDDGYLKVVRSVIAYKEAPPLAKNNTLNQLETDIISLKHIPVNDAFREINYLLSREGRIVVDRPKNLLIITDYPKHIKLIKSILKELDTKEAKRVAFFNLKNADINQIYNQFVNISKSLYPLNIYHYTIVPNTQNNQIILIASNEIINKLSNVIKNLDKKTSINLTTSIIRLKNSDATYLVNVINRIIKMKYKHSKNIPTITADRETNSLIILAKKTDLEIIKSIISSLDIPKEQVYVKAKILEISNTKAADIGLKYGLIGGFSDASSGIYTMSASLGGSALAFNPSDLGLKIPALKQGIALGVTLNLLETLGAAKKLSEPSILCINNTPSTIYVGKTVSVLTGKTTSTSTSESYTRKDIGLTLKVKPRIDSDNKVALNINAVIEDLLPGSPTTLPITSKREITTNAIVKNGQSIIIGGLVRNNNDLTTKKVPFLGDIPIIGNLFKERVKNKDKTTIVILLTPYIVKTPDELIKLKTTLAKLNILEMKFANKLKEKLKEKSKLKKASSNNGLDILGEYNEEDR